MTKAIVITPDNRRTPHEEIDQLYFVNSDTHGDSEKLCSLANYAANDRVLFVNADQVVSVELDENG